MRRCGLRWKCWRSGGDGRDVSTHEIDRKHAGSRRATLHQRRCAVPGEDGKIRLRMILDHCSVEVFVNGGEYVMSATLYTDMLWMEFLSSLTEL